MKKTVCIIAVLMIMISVYNIATAEDHHDIFMKGWEFYNQANYAKAEKLFRKSLPLLFKDADKGDATASYRLGWLYENGIVLKADNEEAVFWYGKGAELGDDSSQYMLGTMYENGQGVEKNIEEAIKWYRKAAEQKNESAVEALKRLEKAK